MENSDEMERPQLILTLIDEPLAICRWERSSQIPAWACKGDFFSVTRTPYELSIVCPQDEVPADVESDPGWRALYSEGPLGFTLTGLVETLAEPLAVAGISIFFISTFHTDFLLVKEVELEIAILTLQNAGHMVRRP